MREEERKALKQIQWSVVKLRELAERSVANTGGKEGSDG